MRVTEKKKIVIDRTCKENPVYLTWLNSLGGREFWLFHKVQTKMLDVREGGDFSTYIEDLETARGQTFDLTKIAIPKTIVGASVKISDIEGIKTMLFSPSVEVLMNPLTWETEGLKWRNVRPVPGSFRLYDTNEVRSQIEITLNFDELNNQLR